MTDLDMAGPTGWIALLLGLYLLFASVGALRKPGIWQQVVADFEKSPALQLTGSFLELLTGSIIFLANPWAPDVDLLACVLKVLGCLMMIEALVVAGFSDCYFHFWLKNLAHMHRGWAMVSFACGLALTVAGTIRFG